MTKTTTAAVNITERLFAKATGKYRATVVATEPGVVAGLAFIDSSMAPAAAGDWNILVAEGQHIQANDILIEMTGTATELGIAEDFVMGPLGFASGIASRAAIFKAACPEGLSIACGGWKKLPFALKPLLRAGLKTIGLLPRLVAGDFVYMSKNAVTLLGGVESAIHAGIAVNHGPVAVQVKNVEEALFAVHAGAGIIMVDTAVIDDLHTVHQTLTDKGLRNQITLAFGGGVKLEELDAIKQAGAEAVDVGRDILNAPLLDLRMTISPLSY